MTDNTTEELEGFLAQHETVAKPTLLRVGTVVDGWRVTGFLGRGGHAEVYRVEAVEDGTGGRAGAPRPPQTAALKILAREDAASRARFEQEIQLLKKHFASSLPYFMAREFMRSRRLNTGEGRALSRPPRRSALPGIWGVHTL